MNFSPSVTSIVPALVRVAAELTDPERSKSADRYKYAPLESFAPQVRRLLAKHDCILVQGWGVNPAAQWVMCSRVVHSSGEFVEVYAPGDPLAKPDRGNAAQAYGSLTSYLRRYGLLGLLGIYPDGEDDDAQSTAPAPKPAKAKAPKPETAKPVEPPPQPTARQRDEDALLAANGLSRANVDAFLAWRASLTGKPTVTFAGMPEAKREAFLGWLGSHDGTEAVATFKQESK